MRLYPWFHYQPDPPAGGASGGSGTGNGGSGGGGGGTGSTSQGGGEERHQSRAEEVRDIVDQLVARHGTLNEALRVLASDNYDYRAKLRDATATIGTLRAKVPADGAVVLTGDDVATWNAVKPLNLKGDKIAERIKLADELEVRVIGGERQTLVTSAAKVVQYNPDVLLAELDRNKLTLELRDGVAKDASGKETPIKIPFVRKADDPKAAWEKLTEYAERDLKLYLPALKTLPQGGASGAGGTNGTSGTSGTPSTFTPLPVMGDGTAQGGGAGGASDLVTRHLESASKRVDRGNPFRKPQGGTSGTTSGATK